MKIAFVYDVPYPWHVGGIEMGNYNEAKELAKENEVHFFTMQWPGMEKEFEKNGIRYHAFHKVNDSKIYRHGRRSIREALLFSLSMVRLFTMRFDVIIANHFPILHLPLVKLYCRLYNCKLVIEVAEVWESGYWMKYLHSNSGFLAYVYSRFLIKGADLYIAISSTTKKEMRKIGIDSSRIRTFIPIVDMNEINSVRHSGKERLVMFAGRLVKEKRLDIWVRVFAKAYEKDSSIRGEIVGTGPERDEILGIIKEMKLEKAIKVIKPFDDKALLYRKMSEASVFMNTSEREGLSIVSIESVALGTPVIIPDYSPIPPEVRRLCIVDKTENLHERILEVIKGKGKAGLRPASIEAFSVSSVLPFYRKEFKRLGLEGR
jgi:glycosyltransferase involved in cell wall biosynthesis